MRYITLAALTCFISGCTVMSSGPIDKLPRPTTTDRRLDVAVDGNGFFIFQTAPKTFLFSRNGHLFVDSNGWLVNEDGYRLVPTEAVPPGATEVFINADGRVMARSDAQAEPQHVADVRLANFAQWWLMDKDGIYYTPNDRSGDPVTGTPGTGAFGKLIPQALVNE